MTALPWVPDDGGRGGTGRRGDAGDCVVRALAIASGVPYEEVYESMAAGEAARGKPRSARNGVAPKVYKAWLAAHGWVWTPKMAIGSGCTVHCAVGEVPAAGRLVLRLSGHLVAIIDGRIHDTSDPSRGGTRCVYGWWEAPR